MKELDIKTQLTDKVRDEIIIKQKQEYKLIGSIRKKPGLTLFEFDLKTFNLNKKEITKTVSIGLNGKPIVKQKAHQNPNGVLIWALNWINAEKKVLKILKGYGIDIEKSEYIYNDNNRQTK